jgi:hypothetical protein
MALMVGRHDAHAQRVTVSRSRLLVLGGAGAAIGHGLTIAAAVPHRSVLASTAHAYWRSAGHAVVGTSIACGLGVLAAHAVAIIRSPSRTATATLMRTQIASLAAFQVLAFTCTEMAERVAAHEPITSAFDHHVFPLGVVVQVLVAAAVVQLLRLSTAAAAVVADWLSRGRDPFPRSRPAWSRLDVQRIVARLWSHDALGRAPPALA